MNEEIKRILENKKRNFDGQGRDRSDRDILEWLMASVTSLLWAELTRLQKIEQSPKEAEPIHMEANP